MKKMADRRKENAGIFFSEDRTPISSHVMDLKRPHLWRQKLAY